MARRWSVVVPPAAGERLDRFLAARYPELSRSAWQAAIRAGHVRVDGRTTKPSQQLGGGERIAIELPEAAAPAVAPAPELSPQAVLYEDALVVVVNKPRGMVVHPARGHHGDSLVERLWDRLAESARHEDAVRPGVVHRLDRDTTGLLVLAKTAEARRYLSQALQAGRVRREYAALALGWPTPPVGVIEAPIGRDPENRLRMAVVLDGRPARTRYRVLRRFRHPTPVTLLWLGLESGRTHQIRVHLAALGHPVVGDPLYGRPPTLGMTAQALHAFRLRFPHPLDGRTMEAVAPVPADWEPAWQALADEETGEAIGGPLPSWAQAEPAAALWSCLRFGPPRVAPLSAAT